MANQANGVQRVPLDEDSNYRHTKARVDERNQDAHQRLPMTREGQTHRYVNMEPFKQASPAPSQTLDELDDINEEDERQVGLEDREQSDEHEAAGDQANPEHGRCQCSHNDYVNDQFDDLDQGQQLNLLRDLLRIERANTENSRANNVALKRYIQQLQMDYLKQQSDLAEALEFSHKLKAQKDSRIATIEETVREKDVLIEQLRANIANLDESKLRREFESNLEKQRQLSLLEQDQLRQQMSSIEQQLAKERASQAQLAQQCHEKLEDQRKNHERELGALCSRLKQTQGELDRLLTEPQNLQVKALKEDKATLECRVDELNIVARELQTKYDNLKGRLEFLMVEQKQTADRNQEEVSQLQLQAAEQRRLLGECKLEVDDKQEVIQILQFNLQRSEKRVKNLLGVMKNKEETYRALVAQMELKHQQEVEKTRNEHRSAAKQLIENDGDLGRKQNELVRLRLEHENQLDSMRNDRDARLSRAAAEKQSLEKELKAAELRLAREIEQTSAKTVLIEQLQKEVKQFREEGKRLSIELTKSEAKLYAKQQELNRSMERLNVQRANSQTELQDSMRMQQVSLELEEERRMSKKLNANIEALKKENGKLHIKLRIAEANLDRMTTAINREHGRMMREYEKKLEQIRSEQATFDKSKLRYRKYGYKLKKYCEHLRRVHEHLCNPSVCGYILGPLRAPAGTKMSPTAKEIDEAALDHCDGVSLLSNDAHESDVNSSTTHLDDRAELASVHSNRNSTDDGYSTRKSNYKSSPAYHDRFIVKRTGLSPVVKRTPSLRARKLSFNRHPTVTSSNAGCTPRVPLKPKDPNVAHSECDTTRLLNEHEYYYINESFGDKMAELNDATCRRAVI